MVVVGVFFFVVILVVVVVFFVVDFVVVEVFVVVDFRAVVLVVVICLDAASIDDDFVFVSLASFSQRSAPISRPEL